MEMNASAVKSASVERTASVERNASVARNASAVKSANVARTANVTINTLLLYPCLFHHSIPINKHNHYNTSPKTASLARQTITVAS